MNTSQNEKHLHQIQKTSPPEAKNLSTRGKGHLPFRVLILMWHNLSIRPIDLQ